MSKYIKERYTGTMPYKFIFNIDHDIYFEAMLESERCVAHNLNGQRCSRNVCIGINLCWSHLLKYKHLKIKTSTIPNAGKGLFAEDKSLAPDAVVFSEGDLIADYIGERIDRDTLIQRYAKHTAPYAFYLKNNVYIDSALERGFASLANAAPTQRQKNARFVPNMRENPQRIQLKATKSIRNGDEILAGYGTSYKFDEEYKTKYMRL